MTEFSALEMAAARLMATQMGEDDVQALLDQLETASVTDRDFTGVGFYTSFAVDRSLPPAKFGTGFGGWVRCEVGPNAYPLEFILYVDAGYVFMIEAYSFLDGYGDLDLLTACFTEPRPGEQDEEAAGQGDALFGD
ncbi:hypothetical protein [Brevundimonas sp. Marseille-Q4549]